MHTKMSFDFVKNEESRTMLRTAYEAINATNTWDYIGSDVVGGFMFKNDPQQKRIYAKIEELGFKGHSGTTFAFTLRQMQRLYLLGGYDVYEKTLKAEATPSKQIKFQTN